MKFRDLMILISHLKGALSPHLRYIVFYAQKNRYVLKPIVVAFILKMDEKSVCN